jgi:hypothetical protein
MDTKAAITKLFHIAQTQQKLIEKLAQAVGAVPAQSTMESADLTQKLQAALFAKHPEMQNMFVAPPQVLTPGDAGAKLVVSFKYHASGAGGSAVRAAVNEAANQVLGQGSFLLQGTGEF